MLLSPTFSEWIPVPEIIVALLSVRVADTSIDDIFPSTFTV